MSSVKLTDEEKRNLEIVKEWTKLYSTYGSVSRMVDEVYADMCEVLTPLQGIYFARLGKSKENWRTLEIEIEKLFKKRHMEVVSAHASGNTVALEAKVTMTTVDGKTYKDWFAAFLTFENGRIIKDHTYMNDSLPRGLPRETFTPGFKQAMKKILKEQ
jgi:ketosteroid isomerase-like protein